MEEDYPVEYTQSYTYCDMPISLLCNKIASKQHSHAGLCTYFLIWAMSSKRMHTHTHTHKTNDKHLYTGLVSESYFEFPFIITKSR